MFLAHKRVDSLFKAEPVGPRIVAGEAVKVLEIGCGNGYAANVLARAFPNTHWTAYDLIEEQVDKGKAQVYVLSSILCQTQAVNFPLFTVEMLKSSRGSPIPGKGVEAGEYDVQSHGRDRARSRAIRPL